MRRGFFFPFTYAVLSLLALIAAPGIGHAAGFNADAATRAYLDTLQGSARVKSDAYFEGGYWIALIGTLVSVAAYWIMLRLRILPRVRDAAERKGRKRALVVFEVAAVFLMASTLLLLPWTIYTGFVREARYGLLNQSFAGWLGEQVIGLFVTLVIGSLLFVVIYGVIRRLPKVWWMVSTGVVSVFLALAMLFAPVYILPLFNTYSELPQGPVRDRIVAMAKAYNVPAEHIYVYDASKQTKRISANVSGIGPTVRISLNDNLLHRASEPEILAAVGHEMGHYVLGHVWRSWIWLTALYGLMLFLAAWAMPLILARYGARWSIRDVADPASMPLLAGVFVVFSLMVTPITNTLVRVTERDADVFGLDAAREPDGFASLAMKLSEYRKIDPGPAEEALFYDHPSGATRVRLAMRWKQIHMPGAPMAKPTPIVLEPMDAQH